jgi:hypothetical protein
MRHWLCGRHARDTLLLHCAAAAADAVWLQHARRHAQAACTRSSSSGRAHVLLSLLVWQQRV